MSLSFGRNPHIVKQHCPTGNIHCDAFTSNNFHFLFVMFSNMLLPKIVILVGLYSRRFSCTDVLVFNNLLFWDIHDYRSSINWRSPIQNWLAWCECLRHDWIFSSGNFNIQITLLYFVLTILKPQHEETLKKR